jgi:hypothetical protein
MQQSKTKFVIGQPVPHTQQKKLDILHKQYKQPHKQGTTTHTNSTAYHKFVISELQQ